MNDTKQTSKAPAFSVIMPTYNRAFCIKTAIDSLLKQTYQQFELIIVDDGSTDRTEQLIQKFYQKYLKSGKFKYIKLNHVGVSAARNVGIKEAKNEWITYLDTDNYLLSNALGVYSYNISKNPGQQNFYGKFISKTTKEVYGKLFNFEDIKKQNTIDLGVYLHTKNLIEKCGAFDETLKRFVDWEMIARHCAYSHPILINEIVMEYNDSTKIKRITTTEPQNKSYTVAYEKIKKILKKKFSKKESTTKISMDNHKKDIDKKHDIIKQPMISVKNKIEILPKKDIKLKDQITIAMATHPQRENTYIDTVWQLLPYCDRFCICFNGYDSPPKNLPKSEKIIAICANNKNGIKDLGCNNKMYWLGDFPGYYATVDDDIAYPPNYISELKNKVDLYHRKAICSFHGHIYTNIRNGRIAFNNRQVFPFHFQHIHDVYCHRVGMGVAMCYPSEIGITKDMFLTAEKNSGDDEITAIWAQKHQVPLICISTANVKILENNKANANVGLYFNKVSMQKRKQYLESYINWKMNTLNNNNIFFRIIIPTFNSEKFLSRCLNSILQQTFVRYKIIIVDDKSTDNTCKLIKEFQEKHKSIIFEQLSRKKYGGGARNAALKYCKDAQYTIFLDSDDYYYENTSLQNLYEIIVKNNYPDLIKCAYQQIQNDQSLVYKFRGKELKDVVHLCSPGTSCIKTSICPDFIENRIRFNDVVWSLRAYDVSKSLAIMEKPLFVYKIGDNPNSCQHANIDQKRIDAIFQLIEDLNNEQFTKQCVIEQKNLIIKAKQKQIKDMNYKYSLA